VLGRSNSRGGDASLVVALALREATGQSTALSLPFSPPKVAAILLQRIRERVSAGEHDVHQLCVDAVAHLRAVASESGGLKVEPNLSARFEG
jgi:hypothetical protein